MIRFTNHAKLNQAIVRGMLVLCFATIAFHAQVQSASAGGVNEDSAANAPWFNIEVDTPNSVGQHTSVAIDPSNGLTYVSYYDATNKALRMAQYIGSLGNCDPNNDWSCRTIDSGADFGKYSSIAIDPASGGVGIAYYDATNGKLKYAYCASAPLCFWSKYTIDKGIFPVSSTGLYTSLKYHTDGTPHIAYHFDNPSGVDALMVASNVDSGGNCGDGTVTGEWQCDTIQTGEGIGQYTSLALDKAGNKHIAYYDRAAGYLQYATSGIGTNCGPGGNTWLCYAISGANLDVGRHASLYVDNDNRFHIAYYNATTDKLTYAVDVGDSSGNCGVLGSAQCDTIDSMGPASHPAGVSMAEDADGYPIIAYQSKAGSLNVARPAAALGLSGGGGNCGPETPFHTWYCETINPHNPWVPYRNGDFVSIAVNPSGLATIAYFGFIKLTDGNLMVSQQRFQASLPLVMKNQ